MLSSNTSLTPEHANFLRQCLKQGHLRDGLRFLASVSRTSFYRFRKRRFGPLLKPRRFEANRQNELPAIITSARSVEFETSQDCPSLAGLDRLFYDVDLQLAGHYRLAGGAYQQVDSSTIHLLDDPEDQHAYHRLYWAVRYAKAAAFGHRASSDALHGDLMPWLLNSSAFGKISRAAYTVSERIASLSEVLFWGRFGNSHQSSTLVSSVEQQIRLDAEYLSQNIEYTLGVHNHLLNNARALFAAHVALPPCEKSQQWKNLAFEIWEQYFPALVLADGTFGEQSSHYHLLLCRTALEYYLAARSSNRPLPEKLQAPLRAMFSLANDLLRSDGSLPRFGDNSPDHIVEDLWGLLAAAHWHGLMDESPSHSVVTPLTVYYGANVAPPARQSSPWRTRLYPAGGFAFLRSKDCATELAVHGDPRPEAGPHGDSGRGSFELWRLGQVIIREPGCFLSPTNSRSRWYRSAEAQNITCIDGLAPTVSREDQQLLPDWYWRESGTWEELPDSRLRFCNQFRRVRRDLQVSRTWSCDDNGSLLFEEELTGSGVVSFTSRIFLGEGHWGPLRESAAYQWQIERQGVGEQTAHILIHLPHGVTPSIEHSSVTPEYGVEEPAQVISLTGSPQVPLRWALRCDFTA